MAPGVLPVPDYPTLEEPSRRQRIEGTTGTAGLLNSLGDQGGETTAADAVTTGAEEEGRVGLDAGRRGFHQNVTQRTG
ncbi:hypothetical protein NDU88_006333 [Pleurodeles waltl]|uniref:Uncharacterized protein n=1 Tax=Pleurodeles waltl TaxID=8319 RepID=A0AAV7RQX9_PLEWA|nr:hypothetical protein NDU88_006333 [Pleurodeles waltl]